MFDQCHGAGAEEIPMPSRPLVILELRLEDGRIYKTIGTDPHQTHSEALKTKLWHERGKPRGR